MYPYNYMYMIHDSWNLSPANPPRAFPNIARESLVSEFPLGITGFVLKYAW